jgi:hypothetical protein
MVDWKILNYLNKQKYKRILLVVKNEEDIKKFIKNKDITIIEDSNFIELYLEGVYDIIATWDSLSDGSAMKIYSYLAKMNHNLRDSGFIYLKVLKNKNIYEELVETPFCWNTDRIKSIGKSKALKVQGNEEHISNKKGSFIRFKYIPSN